MKTAIITTTINVPTLLESYSQNVKQHGHDCFFVVIGDKKTPAEVKGYCLRLQKENGIEIEYMGVDDQIKYLKNFPELGEHLTWNSIQRRNVGIVRAYEKGAEKLITIDDDNYFIKDDFVKLHDVGSVIECDVLKSNTGWLNVCSFLTEKFNRPFYHRGFALERRFIREQIKSKKKKIRVVVNAGFWLGDPDIDAMTRLYYTGNPIDATSYTRKESFAVEKDIWTPFNSQNTSLIREVIPAYFLSPYVGRYDDIWGAYVLKKIADHLDGYIVFGEPLVRQERNPHNYWKDLAKEDMGMMLTLIFIEMLDNISLKNKSYQDCYSELTKGLVAEISNRQWSPEGEDYLNKYLGGMKVWIKTFERLNK